MADGQPEKSDESEKFSDQATETSVGLIREFLAFLTENKKWWLAPIIAALLLVGILVLLSGSVAAPFIYTLF